MPLNEERGIAEEEPNTPLAYSFEFTYARVDTFVAPVQPLLRPSPPICDQLLPLYFHTSPSPAPVPAPAVARPAALAAVATRQAALVKQNGPKTKAPDVNLPPPPPPPPVPLAIPKYRGWGVGRVH